MEIVAKIVLLIPLVLLSLMFFEDFVSFLDRLFLDRLFGKRTIAIECKFCSWMIDEETECEWCNGTGLCIFETWNPDTFREDFIVAWVK